MTATATATPPDLPPTQPPRHRALTTGGLVALIAVPLVSDPDTTALFSRILAVALRRHPVAGAQEPAMTTGGDVLVLTGLTKRWGALTVVDDVELTVRQGSRHALIGPNGAGKSTLFNLVAGIVRPTSGGGCTSVARTSPCAAMPGDADPGWPRRSSTRACSRR